jgi:hypothetical protein
MLKNRWTTTPKVIDNPSGSSQLVSEPSLSLQKTPSDPINPSFAVTQWARPGELGTRISPRFGKMTLGSGDAERKTHLTAKRGTVNLDMKATLPDERSGDGGRRPQGTPQPFPSLAVPRLSNQAHPCREKDAFETRGSNEYRPAAACADGAR